MKCSHAPADQPKQSPRRSRLQIEQRKSNQQHTEKSQGRNSVELVHLSGKMSQVYAVNEQFVIEILSRSKGSCVHTPSPGVYPVRGAAIVCPERTSVISISQRASQVLFSGFLAISLAAGTGLSAQVSYTAMPLDQGFGKLDTATPTVPAQQIIDSFTAKESEFRTAMGNYTYERSVKVE